MAPPRKNLTQRGRRNSSLPGATVVLHPYDPHGPRNVTPNLPKREAIDFDGNVTKEEWHPMAVTLWREIWHSPMASQYTSVDILTMLRVVELQHAFYTSSSIDEKRKCSVELRLLSQLFGLSPLDRARLKWEIDKGDEAEQNSARRNAVQRGRPRTDPRITVPQSEDHVQDAEEVPDGEEA